MQTFLGSTIPEKWKPILKAIIPGQVLELRNKWHDRRRLKQFRSVPTADAFTRIYEEGLWGVGSGHGSSDEFGLPYTDFVVSFGRKHAVRTIVDVGCGDLRIGRRIASAGFSYTGIDVVPALIESHRRQFGADGLQFSCMDVAKETPPAADLCLIRQVLQHLSNKQIKAILNNCRHYPLLLVTEHVPTEAGIAPNRDKPQGAEIRLEYRPRSGVFVELPPFSAPAQVVFEYPYDENEILRTVLIENK